MQLSQVLVVALIGAAAGFGVYCFTCALHVWRKRNHRSSPDNRADRRLGRAACTLLLSGGFACMSVAGIAALLLQPEGLLNGERIVTVRAPKDLQVVCMTEKELVQRGDVLGSFYSPQRKADIEVSRLKIERFRAEKAVLEKEPLKPDSEITRRLMDACSERRHVLTRLNQTQFERNDVERELSRERLTRQDEINQLGVELAQLQRQLTQAHRVLEYNQKQAHRNDELLRRGAATEHVKEEWLRNSGISADEVGKLSERQRNIRVQREEFKKGLSRLITVAEAQLESKGSKCTALTKCLQEVRGREHALEQQLQLDLVRAHELRDCELEQIEVKTRQTEEELAGLEESLQVIAVSEGRVLFRAPSPRSAGDGDPLLVLGPPKGLRVRLRLPRWQRKALERVPDVRLELASQMDTDGDIERHFVERWFSGKFLRWQDLEKDPSHGLAELSCDPPREAVCCLASGNQVFVKMHWSAPLLASPLFATGMILSVVGTVGWMLMAFRQRRVVGDARESSDKSSEDAGPNTPLVTEYGAEGAMLHVLGGQLRESISRREVDRHLLAALEWALDRHRARAVRLVALGLGDEVQLSAPLREFVCRDSSADGNDSDGVLSREDRRRLLRIIQNVAPSELAAHAEELERELDKGGGKATPHLDLRSRGRSVPR